MLGVSELGVCNMICKNFWLFPYYLTLLLGIHELQMLSLFSLTWKCSKTKEYESAAAALQMCEYQKQIVEKGNNESKTQRRSNKNNVPLTLENEEKNLLNNFLCL